MAYTETTSTGWGDRLKGAFGGVVVGIVLIVLGSWLLYWNEGRTVKTGGAINEAKLVTVEMPDISKVDPAFEGKLIHAWGQADPQGEVADPLFGVKAKAVRITRKAQYYQWVEHSQTEKRKKLGGGEETVTTYTYTKEWVSEPIDSQNYHDPQYRTSLLDLAAKEATRAILGGNYERRPISDVGANFVLATFKDEEFFTPLVTFGAYKFTDWQKRGIGGAVPLEVPLSLEQKKTIFAQLNPDVIRTPDLKREEASGDAPASGPEDRFIQAQGNVLYIGTNPGFPSIGDVRVTFTQVPPGEVTIIAQVVGDTFEEFTASNGYTFSRLDMGKVGTEKMFVDAKSENTVMAWILRVVGTLMVVFGLGKVLRPLSVLADVVPILGSLVGGGAGIVAFLLGLAWSLLVIAVAWLRFRPLLAGGLIAGAVVLVSLSVLRGRRRTA